LYEPRLIAVDIDTDADVPTVDCPAVEWQDLAGAPGWGHAALVSVDGAVFVLDAGASSLRCRAVAAPPGVRSADVSGDGEVVVVGGDRLLARVDRQGLRWTAA